MLNPWIINNKIYENCILTLNLKCKQNTLDYVQPSYNRPMVLLFSDNAQATKFMLDYAPSVGRSGLVMKDRDVFHSMNTQVASSAEMVLIKMPEQHSSPEPETMRILGTQQLNVIEDDIMLNLAIVSYALFYYIEHFYVNEYNNLSLNGIIINPLLEVERDVKHDVIMRYLRKMYLK